jgi:hypothetical protein
MSTTATPRTWTTKLRFPDGSTVDLEPPSTKLGNYEGDLLASAASSGVRQAAELLGDESVDGYAVLVFKTTQARGTEFDRSFYLDRDRRGRVVGRR